MKTLQPLFPFLSDFSTAEDDVLDLKFLLHEQSDLQGPRTEPLSRAVTIPALKIFDFKFIKKFYLFQI